MARFIGLGLVALIGLLTLSHIHECSHKLHRLHDVHVTYGAINIFFYDCKSSIYQCVQCVLCVICVFYLCPLVLCVFCVCYVCYARVIRARVGHPGALSLNMHVMCDMCVVSHAVCYVGATCVCACYACAMCVQCVIGVFDLRSLCVYVCGTCISICRLRMSLYMYVLLFISSSGSLNFFKYPHLTSPGSFNFLT